MSCWNEEGDCVAAFVCSLPHVAFALQAESKACRAGLLIAIDQGWTDNELERDCAQLVTALGWILEDRKDYINVVTSLQFVTFYVKCLSFDTDRSVL